MSVLTLDHKGEVEVSYPRRIVDGLRSRMMLIGAKDDRLSFAFPSSLKIRNCVLRVRHGRDARERHSEANGPHGVPPVADNIARFVSLVPRGERSLILLAFLLLVGLVPRKGLEPSRLAPLVPETSASTNSATWAWAVS
jgi:hypothetical protein